MRAGENGRIAIYWDQTEIDGLEAAPLSFLSVGAAWSWRGQARFLVESAEQGQERAGSAIMSGHFAPLSDVVDAASGLLVLTNGAQHFTAILVTAPGQPSPVLVFDRECPARDQEFWISEITETESQGGEAVRANDTVVAFPSPPQLDQRPQVPDRRAVAAAGRRSD